MPIRADFFAPAVVHPGDEPWVPSPSGGVDRIRLDRLGDEVARATSFVRYRPGATFPHHTHGGGEEILVLEGTFSDEHGHQPAGTYLRNPRGSGHAPRTEEGCTLFVKLWQFQADDHATVRLDTRRATWHPGLVPGLSVLPLHQHRHESVALVRWAPGTRFHRHQHPAGEEIVVLEGTFSDEHGDHPAGSWLRSPPWSQHQPWSDEGCLIYVKTGHLPPREPLPPGVLAAPTP